jgi:hypothetical protein
MYGEGHGEPSHAILQGYRAITKPPMVGGFDFLVVTVNDPVVK